MNKPLIVMTGTFLVHGASIAGCSSTSSSSTDSSSPAAPSTTAPIPTHSGDQTYSAATEQTFIQSCTTAGAANPNIQAVCGCTYQGIVKKIPFADYATADSAAAASPGSLPPTISAIATECQANPATY